MRPAADLIESILASVVDIESAAERRRFIHRACDGDPELLRHVEELVDNHFHASTCLESIPGLISFTATRRLTGSVCCAIHTEPIPPSPIGSTSLYGPMTAPGTAGGDARSAASGNAPVATDSAAGLSRKLPAP